MFEFLFPNAPYNVVEVTVLVMYLIVVGVILTGVLGAVFYIVWSRGWRLLSDSMYNGYDVSEGEVPPRWKVRIAAVTAALAEFEFTKIIAAYREADELADDDQTLVDAVSKSGSNGG